MIWLVFPLLFVGHIFSAIFRLFVGLIAFSLRTVGRVMSFVIGLALAGAGTALTITLVGAALGVPLILAGGALMLGAFL